MDGVLINSEMEYIKLFEQFLAENNVFIEREKLYFLAGSTRQVEDEFLAQLLNVDIKESNQRKHAFYELHPLDYMELRKEYVKEILEYLSSEGFTIALASSSPMDNILEVLNQCEIKEYFSLLVSGEMFKESKPNPEIYEYTVKQLGLSKEEILVVEDSNYGVEAAKRAGLQVAAVYDPILQFNVEQADYKIKTLKELRKLVKCEEGSI